LKLGFISSLAPTGADILIFNPDGRFVVKGKIRTSKTKNCVD